MSRFNQCSQCVQRAKLCTLCKTWLCKDHYMSHSCMIDKQPARTAKADLGLDDPSEQVLAYQERRDDELRREEDA